MEWMWGVGYIDLMTQICWIGPSGSFISSGNGDVSAGSFGFLFFVYFIFVIFCLFFVFLFN
jgi:hypothetical protein